MSDEDETHKVKVRASTTRSKTWDTDRPTWQLRSCHLPYALFLLVRIDGMSASGREVDDGFGWAGIVAVAVVAQTRTTEIRHM